MGVLFLIFIIIVILLLIVAFFLLGLFLGVSVFSPKKKTPKENKPHKPPKKDDTCNINKPCEKNDKCDKYNPCYKNKHCDNKKCNIG